MRKRFSPQISLKLFLLVCTLAGVLLAWWLATQDSAAILHDLTASQRRQWTNITDETGSHGELASDGLGKPLFATARNERVIQILQADPSICDRLGGIGLAGADAFRQLVSVDMPALKMLSIGDIDLSNEPISMLKRFERLERLDLPWDPSQDRGVLDELAALAQLTQLTLRCEGTASFEGFEVFEQLRALTIYCRQCDAEDLQSLRARVPNCHIAVAVGTPQEYVWLE